MSTITTWEGMALSMPEGVDRRKTAERILRATEGLGFTAFRHKRGKLYAAEVVGTLQVGKIRINVLPKLDAAADEADSAFLLNLLTAGGYLKNPHVGPAAVGSLAREPMEAVIFHAARSISSALARGAPRRYEQRFEDASTVRGRLDMSRLARMAGSARPRVPVSYFPLTLDNELARCIKGISTLLLAAARTEPCRHLLRSIIHQLASVSPRALDLSTLRALSLSGTEDRWKDVLALGCMLLSGSALNPTLSGNNDAFGFLFPPQHLFERAMRSVVAEAGASLHMHVSHKAHSKYLYQEVPSAQGVVNLKPDYLLSRDGLPVAVADAKWKRLSSASRAHGVSREDFFQVAAYQSRYAVSRALLLYPKAASLPRGLVDWYRCPDGAQSVSILNVDIQQLISSRRTRREHAVAEFSVDLDQALSLNLSA